MRKTNDTFIPSKVLDDIYDIINESICVAGNEDIYFDDIVWPIVRLLDEHPNVQKFLWEDCRNSSNNGGMLFISWVEDSHQLRHEHFKYRDLDEEKRYNRRTRDAREQKSLIEQVTQKVYNEYTYNTRECPDGPCADFCF